MLSQSRRSEILRLEKLNTLLCQQFFFPSQKEQKTIKRGETPTRWNALALIGFIRGYTSNKQVYGRCTSRGTTLYLFQPSEVDGVWNYFL